MRRWRAARWAAGGEAGPGGGLVLMREVADAAVQTEPPAAGPAGAAMTLAATRLVVLAFVGLAEHRFSPTVGECHVEHKGKANRPEGDETQHHCGNPCATSLAVKPGFRAVQNSAKSAG